MSVNSGAIFPDAGTFTYPDGGVQADNSGTLTSPAGVTTTYAYHPYVGADTYTYGWSTEVSLVQSVTRGSSTWNYNFTDPGNQTWTSTVTDPLGHVRTVVSNGRLMPTQITSDTDELGRTTSYTYYAAQPAHIQQVTFPGGDYKVYTYDSRDNVTQEQYTPAGGGTPITQSAVYPATCTYAVNCNEPTATIDGNGNETDYTYDPTHGGVLTETGPADSSGVRPQTNYTYALLYPQILNSSGTLVNSTPVYKLVQMTKCRSSTNSCAGTADQTVTTYAYNTPNLLKTSETVAAGDGSVTATTTYTYDVHGNVTVVDGPRTDVDDRTYATYDVMRRKLYDIGVDPDGSGPLPRVIVHHVYNLDGRETQTATGTGNATDGSDFSIASYKAMTFDSTTGLLVKTISATVP